MNSFLPIKTSDIVNLLGAIPHPEGGFFVETHRSGCAPMSTRGQTGCTDPKLVVTTDRAEHNDDVRRNGLTSIFWIPTLRSSTLLLGINMSDHVHYYQGGRPFEYVIYRPDTRVLERQILGPDVLAGHRLQVIVPGGSWKCGRMLIEEYDDGGGRIPQEYSIIGEGVGPGFDFRDFRICTSEDLSGLDENVQCALRPYLRENLEGSDHDDDDDEKEDGEGIGGLDFEGYYDEDKRRGDRAYARS